MAGGIKQLFKLEKLEVYAFKESKRSRALGSPFRAMYNPQSFSISHRNVFENLKGINTSGRQAKYSHSESDSLALDLVIDGTGVADFGAAHAVGLMGATVGSLLPESVTPTPSVSAQIDDFLEKCFYMDGNIHEPKFLRIIWGTGELKKFDCRLKSVKINYSMFDRSGAALRATLNTEFVADMDPVKRAALVHKNSPDLSHVRTVRDGDTLPAMCDDIYGSASHYLFVAHHNDLDDFRNLQYGIEIRFPPLQD